jgi:hypothetical protein
MAGIYRRRQRHFWLVVLLGPPLLCLYLWAMAGHYPESAGVLTWYSALALCAVCWVFGGLAIESGFRKALRPHGITWLQAALDAIESGDLAAAKQAIENSADCLPKDLHVQLIRACLLDGREVPAALIAETRARLAGKAYDAGRKSQLFLKVATWLIVGGTAARLILALLKWIFG